MWLRPRRSSFRHSGARRRSIEAAAWHHPQAARTSPVEGDDDGQHRCRTLAGRIPGELPDHHECGQHRRGETWRPGRTYRSQSGRRRDPQLGPAVLAGASWSAPAARRGSETSRSSRTSCSAGGASSLQLGVHSSSGPPNGLWSARVAAATRIRRRRFLRENESPTLRFLMSQVGVLSCFANSVYH